MRRAAICGLALLLLASAGLACGKYGPPVREPSVPPAGAAPAVSPSAAAPPVSSNAAAPAGEECKDPDKQPGAEKTP